MKPSRSLISKFLIEEVPQEYQEGKVKFSSVTDFLKELDNVEIAIAL